MKLTMEKVAKGEDEVIIRYHEMNEQVETLAEIVKSGGRKICAVIEGQTLLLSPECILYLESVDGVTYAYLKDRVCKVQMSLFELALTYENRGFFRCSKSMVLNIYKIGFLKSEPGNRIRATMENGEQVMISRRYAKALRQKLKGGVKEDEE
ncbi:LytTR family DNA-binding domain-containing protein [Parablautia muri]|uniref:LytTR family transcriptional regulator n=1 Tax=Parablautia muri TaxID=2320879 RepID=A0A9X5BHS6_9FIRM|nr:LytTR family DNA-binding domain-containing protein [Parablautia muri]NBJ93988.1 LytTR family transcriptional regulator [Parablautia muri]